MLLSPEDRIKVRRIESRASVTSIRLPVRIRGPLSLKNLIALLEFLPRFLDFRGPTQKNERQNICQLLQTSSVSREFSSRSAGRSVFPPWGSDQKGVSTNQTYSQRRFLFNLIVTWLFPPNSPAEIIGQPLHSFNSAFFKAIQRFRVSKMMAFNLSTHDSGMVLL